MVVEVPPNDASPSGNLHDIEIVVGDVVIRAGSGSDEGQLTRAIRAARAAAACRAKTTLTPLLHRMSKAAKGRLCRHPRGG